MTATILDVHDLVAGYITDMPIVRGVSFTCGSGEVVGILGPNGAGKSTFIKALAGIVRVFDGTAMINGAAANGLPPHKVVGLGVGFVPQLANIFTTLSVEDNLRAGGYSAPREVTRRMQELFELFPDLASYRSRKAGELSGGQRQIVALARALMPRPRLLLLDEPSAGLSPKLVTEVFSRIRDIAQLGIAVVLVEQNVRAALSIADRAVVLVNGRIALSGTPAELSQGQVLTQAFLGRMGH